MKINTKELSLIAFNTVFIAIAAQIVIPFGIVPFTLQVFALSLIALVYETRIALCSVLIYLLLGFIGLPFFNSMQSGMMMFLSPTVGFLLGFPGYVLILSKLKDRFLYPVSFILSSFYLYLFGLIGIHLIFRYVLNIPLTITDSIVKYALVFIPTDFISYSLAYRLKDKLSYQLKLD